MVNWTATCGTEPTNEFHVAFGCGGNVGRHIAPLLAGIEGILLRFIVHYTKPDIGTDDPKAASIEYMRGDLKSKTNTAAALAGKPDRVLLIMPTTPDIPEIMQVFLQAIRCALDSVKQIVWIMECDPPLVAERTSFYKYVPATVAAVKARRQFPVTRIEPANFLPNSVSCYGLADAAQSGADTFTGAWEPEAMRFVDTRDVAKAAAIVLIKQAQDHVGKSIRLVGEIRPMAECVVVCGAVIRRKMRYHQISEQEWSKQLHDCGYDDRLCQEMPVIERCATGYVYGFDEAELADLFAVCYNKGQS